MPSEEPPSLAQLPSRVRARVRVLTADVLPAVPRLPAPLRRVADFAPARRATLGGSAIESALSADDDFRERVGVQVLATVPSDPPVTDPVETAALGWLTRPEGWEAVVAEAVTRLGERSGLEAGAADDQVARWRRRAEASEQTLREVRARHREVLSELKAENTALRRKLNEARVALRNAMTEAEAADRAAEVELQQARAAAAAADRELRQLRQEVERLRDERQSDRRAARSERDEATLRARLLLDTVVDAATGLRRELALPPVAGAPGDRVEGTLATEGSRTSSAVRSVEPSNPAAMEQYLALPKARLIVDGYNVSKTAWPSSSLEAQRTRLLDGLAPLVARTGAETTVVFDAAATTARPVVRSPRGVKVIFSPEGVIADDTIHQLVEVEPAGRVVVVVTNDQELARRAQADGARVVSAEALTALLARGG